MILGELLCVGCCAFYLAWWSVAFHPVRSYPLWLKAALFIPMLGLGLGGCGVMLLGVRGLCAANAELRVWPLVIGAIAIYVLLLIVSNLLLHRQVTTELFLIMATSALQVCVVYAFGFVGVWSGTLCLFLYTLIVAVALASLICYLRYYELPPMSAFRVAMVPLVLIGVSMGLMAVLTVV